MKKSVKKTRYFQVIRNGVVFELQSESEGGYTITVPSMPGCVAFGKSFEKAIDMIKDAMAGWLEAARKEGVPIPEQFDSLQLSAI